MDESAAEGQASTSNAKTAARQSRHLVKTAAVEFALLLKTSPGFYLGKKKLCECSRDVCQRGGRDANRDRGRRQSGERGWTGLCPTVGMEEPGDC